MKYCLIFLVLITFQIESVTSQIPITQIEGFLELYVPTDTTSLYIGKSAGQKILEGRNKNVFIGSEAGASLERGHDNILLGAFAGKVSQISSDNIFIGTFAGYDNIDGDENVFIGSNAGEHHEYGDGNVIIGEEAGIDNQGNNNVFVGQYSGSDGDYNTHIGSYAAFALSSNNYNSFFGYGAGLYLKGNSNIAIGANSGPDRGSSVSSRDSTLFIDVEEGELPLIYGEFNNDVLRANGTLQINNPSGKNSILRMQGNGGTYNEVIRYDSINNDVIMGSVSGGGGKLLLRSNSDTRMTIVENGDVGIGTTSPTQRLHVDGNGYFSNWLLVEDELFVNNVQAGSGTSDLRYNATTGRITSSTSDQRLKENITTIDNALDKILSLRGVSFTWKDMPDSTPQFGLIAQEVVNVLPEVVSKNKNGYYGVDYSETIGVFVEAIRDQQEMIVSQQKEIDELRSQLNLALSKINRVELSIVKGASE